jgi:hypothetical protein
MWTTLNPDGFLDWLLYFANMTSNFPFVHSISYGKNGQIVNLSAIQRFLDIGEDEDTVDCSHALRIGHEILKMSAQGLDHCYMLFEVV